MIPELINHLLSGQWLQSSGAVQPDLDPDRPPLTQFYFLPVLRSLQSSPFLMPIIMLTVVSSFCKSAVGITKFPKVLLIILLLPSCF